MGGRPLGVRHLPVDQPGLFQPAGARILVLSRARGRAGTYGPAPGRVFNGASGAATVILFTLIIATHVLSAVVALFVITALTLTRQLRRRLSCSLPARVRRVAGLCSGPVLRVLRPPPAPDGVRGGRLPAVERLRAHQRERRPLDRWPAACGRHRDRVRARSFTVLAQLAAAIGCRGR